MKKETKSDITSRYDRTLNRQSQKNLHPQLQNTPFDYSTRRTRKWHFG